MSVKKMTATERAAWRNGFRCAQRIIAAAAFLRGYDGFSERIRTSKLPRPSWVNFGNAAARPAADEREEGNG